MTGQKPGDGLGRAEIDGAGLRRRLADVATAIACTEDQIAETMERMATAFPDKAAKLRANAARARRFATMGRNRAAALSLPS